MTTATIALSELAEKGADADFIRQTLQHALQRLMEMDVEALCQAVLAMINTIFVQETPELASGQWRTVADQLRPKFPKLAAMMDDAEHEVLAFHYSTGRCHDA